MKKFSVLLLLLTAFALTAENSRICARAEKPSCIYATGEKAIFNISLVDENNNPVSGKEISFKIEGEKGFKTQSGKIISTAEPYKLEMTLDKPGFLHIFLSTDGKKNVELGAAFSPEKIVSSTPDPADFDEFWAKETAAVKSRLAKAKVTCTEIEPPEKFKGKVRCFDLRVDDGIIAATGIFAIPVDAQKGRHPLIMCFNGASKIGADFAGILNQARAYKSVVFNMNLHDTKNIVTRQERDKLRRDPAIFRYFYRDADSLGKYGVGTVFRRVILCREYLKTLPWWDGETIIARGGSMGGAQAIVASAFEPKMKLCIAGAPAMCSHYGFLQELTPGWPKLFLTSPYKAGSIKHDGAMKTMAYFDVVNFAKRVKCKAVVTVGFIDYICSPASVYAAYNVMGSKDKSLYTVPRGNHGRNLDPESKAPGVFSYGGNQVQKAARDGFRKAAQKK